MSFTRKNKLVDLVNFLLGVIEKDLDVCEGIVIEYSLRLVWSLGPRVGWALRGVGRWDGRRGGGFG